jgi:predicted metalloprotease with PDZ domain
MNPKGYCYILILIILSQSNTFAQTIQYTLIAENPHRHIYQVKIDYQLDGESYLNFAMPAWNPGDYHIHNMAKNVFEVKAAGEQRKELPCKKIDKQTWSVETQNQRSVTLTYKVYAYSNGVPYTFHLEKDFGFYNGAFLFMYIKGKLSSPVKIKFEIPEDWDLHTSLQYKLDEQVFSAPNYDEFIDSPTFMGKLEKFSFDVMGKMHFVVLNGGYDYNKSQISKDLSSLVNWFANMFGELPYRHYTFFLRIAEPARGGMEHLNSNISCVEPASLSGNLADTMYYDNLLMLESHEYFHLYNVKRIRPTGLGPFDYTKEVYTDLLWVCEGFTSYYTHRPLVKAGIIEKEKIFPNWARYYNDLRQNSALYIKPVSQYSFDAWLFKADIPDYTNRVYYRKGAFIAMILDIDMRLATDHQKNMDGFFRYLYVEIFKKGKTFDLSEFLSLLNSYSGQDYSDFFSRFVSGIEPLPLSKYLDSVGLEFIAEQEIPLLGIKLDNLNENNALVKYVYQDSPADKLKIGRGDRILSLNGVSVNRENWASELAKLKIGKEAELIWRHRRETKTAAIQISEARTSRYSLGVKKTISKEQLDFLQKWLDPDS